MKRFILLTLLCTALAVPHTSSALSLREEILSSVVQIVAVSEEGEVMGGSGTTISNDGLILTNYHVVQDVKTEIPFSSLTLCYTISQYEPPRCAANAKIVASNKEYDLALIKPDKKIAADGTISKTQFQRYWKTKGNHFAPVLFKNPATGTLPNILDSVTAWGYPVVGGSTITVTRGSVSGFSLEGEENDRIIKFLKTDVYINPGNSGGAAFDEYYSYIGIPSNAYPGQLGFMIPVNAAVDWMKFLDAKKIINIKKIESVKSMNFHFTDIDEDDPLQNVALMLNHLGLMKPTVESKFLPDAFLTQADAVALLYKTQKVLVEIPKFKPNSPITEKDFIVALDKEFKRHSSPIGSTEPITRAKAAFLIFQALEEK